MVGLERLKKVPNPAWYTMTIVKLALSICGIIIVCIVWYFANELIYSYGVIIDAGSTSTKIYLYKWPEIASRTNGEVSEVFNCKASPGISNYMNAPSEASDSIQYCLEQEITPNIPKRLRKKSFLYLGATAGMRLIEFQNPNATKSIFESVESYLLTSGYKMKPYLADVKVISEAVEGIAAWISVNYLKGTLQTSIVSGYVEKKANKTYGALDLGGASTQITFVPNNTSRTDGMSVIRLYGADYNVYTHSYLCYGKSSAELRLLAIITEQWIKQYDYNQNDSPIINPCMPSGSNETRALEEIISFPCVTGQYALDNFGFSIDLPKSLRSKSFNVTYKGSGDPEQCHNNIKKLFNVGKCSHDTCGFNNIYQPKISDTDEFMAFSGYYLMYSILQNHSNTPISYDDYLLKAKSYCKQQQQQPTMGLSENPEHDYRRRWRCFGYLYIFQLLTNLGFNSANWQSIRFINSINNATLAWSLGYMINKTSMIPIEKPVVSLSLEAFVAILLICLVIVFIGCLFAIISFKLHRSKHLDAKPSEQKELKSNVYGNADEEVASKV